MASGSMRLGSGPDDGDLPGALLEPDRLRSRRCSRLLRARTPRLRVQRGPSASHLHKGRAEALGPTPLTIKLADVEGVSNEEEFLCVPPPPSNEREGIYKEAYCFLSYPLAGGRLIAFDFVLAWREELSFGRMLMCFDRRSGLH